MTVDLLMSNLLLWSAQAAILLAVTAALACLLKSAPGARLALWQIALAACMVLPFFASWQEQAVMPGIPLPITRMQWVRAVRMHNAPVLHWPTSWEWLALLLIVGAVFRFGLLAMGLVRLRRYRREAQPFVEYALRGAEAELLTSHDVLSPVTFGFTRPVILLPSHFATLAASLREPIIYHEILHVRRKDWLFAVAEECLRSVLWFHPAVWWAIREIQLAREEAVDREVVDTLNARETYVDALLAIAATPLGNQFAAAPLFVRRKHLKRRVISIFTEVKMSKKSSVSALLTGCCALVVSAWLITGIIPLKAQPQTIRDGQGVTVDTGGAALRHRPSVNYPSELLATGADGTVVAQVRTDGSGNVVDATILSGPDPLRKYVLQSVLNWHFAGDSANTTRQVSVSFTTPKAMIADVVPHGVEIAGPARASNSSVIESITVRGLPDSDRDELLSRLPIHTGDTLDHEHMAETTRAVRAYDQHLNVMWMSNKATNGAAVTISVAPAMPTAVLATLPAPASSSSSSSPKPIRVNGTVAAANVISQPAPEYPPLARAAQVQGTIQFEATIGTDGMVQNLHLISGPPLLVQAAMLAAQKYVYKPTLLNGQPVEVITTISIDFVLP